MKGSVGVLTKLFYLFSGTPFYNKAYMKNIISFSNFTNSQKAQFRLKVIEFDNKYNTKATGDAFSIPRRTIFYWKRLLKEREGKLESLIPKKKTSIKKKKDNDRLSNNCFYQKNKRKKGFLELMNLIRS